MEVKDIRVKARDSVKDSRTQAKENIKKKEEIFATKSRMSGRLPPFPAMRKK